MIPWVPKPKNNKKNKMKKERRLWYPGYLGEQMDLLKSLPRQKNKMMASAKERHKAHIALVLSSFLTPDRPRPFIVLSSSQRLPFSFC